jgi:PIN domain nuclease of toxin-antitoxin system
MDEAEAEGAGVFVSPISAWEIAMLVAGCRLALSAEPEVWFRALLDAGIGLAPLTPEVLSRSSFLPGEIHGDPADRILASTARMFDYRLMTRDRRLLDYAAEGHIHALAC